MGNEIIEQWAQQNGLRIFANDEVKIISRTGRVTDRNLLLCFDAIYIVNLKKLVHNLIQKERTHPLNHFMTENERRE
jgi:hypothetical protein